MKHSLPLTFLFAFLLTVATVMLAAQTQQPSQTQPANDVPVTDGQAGPCSIEFTVTGTDAKPVYAARIDFRLAYGFMGTHKLEMGVYTNAQGKARFIGLPARVKRSPVEFRATKDELVGVATMDPATECQASHDIVMDKAKTQSQPAPNQ